MNKLLIVLFALLAALPLSGADRPNIVYILADDMGYGDLGCFGQEKLTTPHLDRLAADGMKLTRHYAGSTVCAPSRCVLMTGLHTGHCTVRGNGDVLLKPGEVTVAQKLREAGYRTGCFGKWGIGHPPPRDDPNRHGFDEFYGYVNMFHAHNFYPEFLIRNGEVEKLENVLDDPWKEEKGYEIGGPKEGAGVAKVKKQYAPDLITRAALEFIEANQDGPFFLYFPLNMPHANNEAGRAPYDNGMEVPGYGEYADESWPDPEKGFAQMMRKIDDYVGSIVALLEELELTEDTLILFSSDNGPHKEGGHDAEFFDSNGPLRGTKRDLYEGGIRVPTIAKWPGQIAAGTESDVLSGFQDVFPTLAELAGVEAPEILDGISLVPTLLGDPEKQKRHDYLYWEFQEQGGKRAITDGKWKLIQFGTQKASFTPPELYDLSVDPVEQHNVAQDNAELVDRLLEKLVEHHHPEE